MSFLPLVSECETFMTHHGMKFMAFESDGACIGCHFIKDISCAFSDQRVDLQDRLCSGFARNDDRRVIWVRIE